MTLAIPSLLPQLAAAENGCWGVAVSGGGDSVALLKLCLAAGFAPERLKVLNFNHRWSEFGDTAAAFVQRLGDALGMTVIRGQGQLAGQPASNAEEVAREERQGWLLGIAKQEKLAGWLTGHSRTDQVEHLLMRLGRGSGLSGLTGMRRETTRTLPDGRVIRIIRPLLGLSRAELRDYLQAEGQAWLEDPGNARSFRGRLREVLPALQAAGFDEAAAAASLRHLARAEATLVVLNQEISAALLEPTPTGLRLDRLKLLGLPWEFKLRVIGETGLQVSGEEMAPRLSKRARLLGQMHGEEQGVATLGGCRWQWHGAEMSVMLEDKPVPGKTA